MGFCVFIFFKPTWSDRKWYIAKLIKMGVRNTRWWWNQYLCIHVDGLVQKNVTPLLTHWSYVSLAPSHPCIQRLLKVMDFHDDVIKWNCFPRYWPIVRGIHPSLVKSPHKGQWRGDLMFSLICTKTNDWASHRDAGDLKRHRAYYNVVVMIGKEDKYNHEEILEAFVNP